MLPLCLLFQLWFHGIKSMNGKIPVPVCVYIYIYSSSSINYDCLCLKIVRVEFEFIEECVFCQINMINAVPNYVNQFKQTWIIVKTMEKQWFSHKSINTLHMYLIFDFEPNWYIACTGFGACCSLWLWSILACNASYQQKQKITLGCTNN